jgi:DNA invertase Pin-like site-specific DNA recombinase
VSLWRRTLSPAAAATRQRFAVALAGVGLGAARRACSPTGTERRTKEPTAHDPFFYVAVGNGPVASQLLPAASIDVSLGKPGFGLDAQKDAVHQRLNGGRWQLVAEFVEIESGKRAKRPQFDAALVTCKKQKAKLVVAKLDRLSRNVSFLLKLIDSGVEILFADLPELNGAMGRFMLTTMASVAELEAGLISERTRAALKAAKARGIKLGRYGGEVLAPKFKEEARQRAMELEPFIAELKGKGLSLAKIASELNRHNVATPRGGRWDHSSVRNVLKRM